MSKAVLKIEGMTCNHCVSAVERALRSQDGVRNATVHLQQGKADVEYEEGKVATDQLVAAVEEEGYSAQVSG